MATLTAMQHMQGLQQHPIISLRQFSCRRHAVLRVAQAPSHQLSRAQVIAAAARREGGRFRDDEVYFDGEEDWQDDVSLSAFTPRPTRLLLFICDPPIPEPLPLTSRRSLASRPQTSWGRAFVPWGSWPTVSPTSPFSSPPKTPPRVSSARQ